LGLGIHYGKDSQQGANLAWFGWAKAIMAKELAFHTLFYNYWEAVGEGKYNEVKIRIAIYSYCQRINYYFGFGKK
jgi:hypothetical protein